jgi:hypothetical protein
MGIEKEFVPYDLALKLKKIGFDEPCFGFYNDNNIAVSGYDGGLYFLNNAPLYQQAFRWFRRLGISNHIVTKNYRHTYQIAFMHIVKTEIGVFKSYEEAEQDCLEELIKTEILLNKPSNNRGKH